MEHEIKEIKTVTITKKGQICIPHEARHMAGFREGTKTSIIVYADRIELRPFKKAAEDMLPAFISEDVLAKAWNTPEEDEAWKDL